MVLLGLKIVGLLFKLLLVFYISGMRLCMLRIVRRTAEQGHRANQVRTSAPRPFMPLARTSFFLRLPFLDSLGHSSSLLLLDDCNTTFERDRAKANLRTHLSAAILQSRGSPTTYTPLDTLTLHDCCTILH
jgi:hypothetical protein